MIAEQVVRSKAQMELNRRKKKRRSEAFSTFIEDTNPSLLDYEHVPKMVDVLQNVADTFNSDWTHRPGEPNYKRVIFMMPPRYFKSETTSRLFSPYFTYRYPEKWVGITSYGANLAWELNGQARTYYKMRNGAVEGESSSVQRWETGDGGGVWADGVGGSLIGKGYHVGIIDDPIKPQDARSSTYQKKFENWYPETFLSREEPGAAIILVMQRLSTWDPIEFLFQREVEEEPEHWHVVCLDEIKSNDPLSSYDGPQGLPKTCTLEPDDRKEGEILAPSRFDEETVYKKQSSAGTITASAQRQQRPNDPTGDFWKQVDFKVYDELPEHAYNGGKDWDTAYTKNEKNSATAFTESYRGPGEKDKFPIYIHDCDWNWFEFPEMVSWMKGERGPHYIEQKASGKSAAQSLKRDNVAVKEVPVEGGDKLARAAAVQNIVRSGRVYIRRSIAKRMLKGDRQGLLHVTAENLADDNGHLDLNDSFVQALNRHAKPNSTTIGGADVDL